MKFVVIVPTYNAGPLWLKWIDLIKLQKSIPIKIINIDSSSTDETVSYSIKNNFEVKVINKNEFGHGRTRNLGVKIASKYTPDVIIFMTQDSLLESPDVFQQIISFFDDSMIAAAYGRQLSHLDANPIAKHARFFNYSEFSQIKSMNDIHYLGIKVAFMSNSFAAYRRDVFEKLGGFPENTILAEDMYLAAKMILAGYKVAYCAEATVRHSHNYTPCEEFHRYFDTGVFHACEPWIQQRLGGASGEGIRFIKSELNYLWHHAPLWIPRALLTTGCKFLGYKLGRHYKTLPKSWRSKFSMYRSYWLQQKY